MMRGLYPILDTTTLRARHMAPLDFAAEVLRARPCALQLRAKEDSDGDVLALLRELAPLCQRAAVPLVCNDRPDLAVLAGCDMVHVGQEDAPIEAARRIAPHVPIGVSTHDLNQLARAIEARPAYVAYGPIFPTSSKQNPDRVVGLDGLRAASELARRASIPLVAIGGITLERAPEVAQWADCAAVIAGVFAEGRTLFEQASALHAALGARG
ncbi:thiamine phosphate synthase [Pendulispora albinea]|uniref:Thiamine-phosphate synthase n=1 Tax=Pendulispora albinea TaxID=2741071 RepID=A0ABZ2LNY3_9BACT